MKILEEAITHLIAEKPFYGYMCMNAKKRVTKNVPTAGVYVTDCVNLVINEEFFSNLSLDQRVQVLKHEVLHLCHEHIERGKALSKTEFRNFNVAADIAINQLISGMPDTLEVNGQQMQLATLNNLRKYEPNALANQTAEYYYKLIKESDNIPKTMVTTDDHGEWEKSDGTLSKDVLRQAAKEAAEYAKNTKAGNMSLDEQLLVDKLLKSKVNWRQQFRNFISSADETKKKTTRNRRNKRYGLTYPGTKRERLFHLAVAMDVSGSISQEQRSMFFIELDKILELGYQITVMTCDTEVKDVFKYEKKGKLPEIHGGGGTMYNPVMLKVRDEIKPDALVFFGDMDCFDEKDITNPGIPLLWAITGKQNPPTNFGRKLYIDE